MARQRTPSDLREMPVWFVVPSPSKRSTVQVCGVPTKAFGDQSQKEAARLHARESLPGLPEVLAQVIPEPKVSHLHGNPDESGQVEDSPGTQGLGRGNVGLTLW